MKFKELGNCKGGSKNFKSALGIVTKFEHKYSLKSTVEMEIVPSLRKTLQPRAKKNKE